MHSLLTFVLVAVLATCALAAPTPNKALVKRTFSYSVKPRRAIIRTPRQELVRTYNKFGWQIVLWNPTDSPFGNLFGGDSTPDSSPAAPASTPAAAGSSDTASTAAAAAPAADGGATGGASSSGGKSGEVAATPEQGESEYLEKVTVGGQSLNLDFDTGSADLYVLHMHHSWMNEANLGCIVGSSPASYPRVSPRDIAFSTPTRALRGHRCKVGAGRSPTVMARVRPVLWDTTRSPLVA